MVELRRRAPSAGAVDRFSCGRPRPEAYPAGGWDDRLACPLYFGSKYSGFRWELGAAAPESSDWAEGTSPSGPGDRPAWDPDTKLVRAASEPIKVPAAAAATPSREPNAAPAAPAVALEAAAAARVQALGQVASAPASGDATAFAASAAVVPGPLAAGGKAETLGAVGGGLAEEASGSAVVGTA